MGEKHLIYHYHFHFFMWLPLLEILLFHLEEACTPIKAYFTCFVFDVSLNFLLPTMEEFITHLSVRIAFCHSIMALKMQVLIRYWSTADVNVTLPLSPFKSNSDNIKQWYRICMHRLIPDIQMYHNWYLLWKYHQIHEWFQSLGALSLVHLMVLSHLFLLIDHVETTYLGSSIAGIGHPSSLIIAPQSHNYSLKHKDFKYIQNIFNSFSLEWWKKFRSHWFLRISTNVIYLKKQTNIVTVWL